MWRVPIRATTDWDVERSHYCLIVAAQTGVIVSSQATENINEEEAVRRAVTLLSEALGLLDSVECKSTGAALLDHAMHRLIADYEASTDGLRILN